ncbi:MAG: hypothetical protein WCO63_10865 [Bacteroidota bacterium]
MNITLTNYEAFFLDYYEKSLSPTGVAELMIFLEANPHLKTDFEEFELLLLEPDSAIVFENKESLKKKSMISVSPIHVGNYEEYLISSVENILSPADEAKLTEFIALNPEVKRELELFRLTVLQPDPAVIFYAKSSLRKEVTALMPVFRPGKPLYAFLAAAASLTILFVVFWMLKPFSDKTQLAQQLPSIQMTTPLAPARALQSKKNTLAGVPAIKPMNPGNLASDHHGKLNQIIASSAKVTAQPVQPLFADATIRELPALTISHIPANSSAYRSFKTKKRTEFSEVYNYYLIRNQLEYAQYIEDQQSRSLFAKAVSKFREGVSGEEEFNPNAEAENMLGWSVADLGVRGINVLTKSDFRLIRRTNSEGKTLSYVLKSDRAEFSKDLDK